MAGTAVDVMGARGDEVATAGAGDTLRDVVATLAGRRVGALVIVDDDHAVLGVLSERDVVRRLSSDGPTALELLAQDVMTSDVTTCEPATGVEDLLQMMTDGRFRHVPVVEGGRLAGIVSIGDVVKAQIDALAVERDRLAEYVAGGS